MTNLRAGDVVTTVEQIASLPPRSTLLCRVGEIFWCAPVADGPHVWFGAGYDPAQYEWDDAGVAEWAPLTVLHVGVDPFPELIRALDQEGWVGPTATDGPTAPEALAEAERATAQLYMIVDWIPWRPWRFWIPSHYRASCPDAACQWTRTFAHQEMAALAARKHPTTSEHRSA